MDDSSRTRTAAPDPLHVVLLAEQQRHYAADPMPPDCGECGGTLTRGVCHIHIGRWVCLDCVARGVTR
jgi:hypothetical protein